MKQNFKPCFLRKCFKICWYFWIIWCLCNNAFQNLSLNRFSTLSEVNSCSVNWKRTWQVASSNSTCLLSSGQVAHLPCYLGVGKRVIVYQTFSSWLIYSRNWFWLEVAKILDLAQYCTPVILSISFFLNNRCAYLRSTCIHERSYCVLYISNW